MTPDRLARKGDESSAVVSIGNSPGAMFQEPQQGFGGLIKRLNIKQQNQKAKELLFFTWDGPDDLRGVPQAHKGELVEPPRANVPDFNWAPLPFVHYLFPGVTIWTASTKYKKKWGKEQKKKSCIVRKIAPLCKDSSASLLGNISRQTTPKSSGL